MELHVHGYQGTTSFRTGLMRHVRAKGALLRSGVSVGHQVSTKGKQEALNRCAGLHPFLHRLLI